MKEASVFLEVRDSAAVLETAARMLVRTNSVPELDAARAELGGDLDYALRLLVDQAVTESLWLKEKLARGSILVHDSVCADA